MNEHMKNIRLKVKNLPDSRRKHIKHTFASRFHRRLSAISQIAAARQVIGTNGSGVNV